MINQMQLLLLLLLTGAYIPDQIVKFLSGFVFLNFSFDFIQVEKYTHTESIVQYFDEAQNNAYLNDVGMTSKSAFVVNYSFFVLLVPVAGLNVVVWLLHRQWAQNPARPKWYHRLVKHAYSVLTFAFYIRSFIEAYQILLVSS